MKNRLLSVIAGLGVIFAFLGAASTVHAQTDPSEDFRKEMERELESAGKAYSEKVSGLLSRQAERIGTLEKSLKDKDQEIAQLKAQMEELSRKMAQAQPKAQEPPAKPKGTPLLGIEPAAVEEEARSKLNLKEGQGSKIVTVFPGSPAEKGGIQPGDIVLSVGGKEASGVKIRDLIQTFAPGDKIEVVLLRGAEKLTKPVELVERDAFLSQAPARPPRRQEEKQAPVQPPPPPPAPKGPVVLGLLVEDTDKGPLVQNVEPGKTGALAQIKEGDIILSIDGQKTKAGGEIAEVLGKAKIGAEMTLVFQRKDEELTAKVIAAGEGGEPKLVGVTSSKVKEPEPQKTVEATKPAEQPAVPKGPATLAIQVLDAGEGNLKVLEVKPGGAGAAAGIEAGDIITEAAGKPIKSIDDLKDLLKSRSAGDVIAVTIIRKGETKSLANVKLGVVPEVKKPEDKPAPKPEPTKKPRGVLGVTANETEDGKGIVIAAVNQQGPADKAGLRKDDLVLKVNGKEIRGFDDLESILKAGGAGDKLVIEVKRGGEMKTIEVILGSPETSFLIPSRGAPERGLVVLGAAVLE